MAVAFQLYILPAVPEISAGHGLLKGDPEVFHQAAANLAEKIANEGWQNWKIFPTGHSFNVGLLALLYFFFGPHPLVMLPLNAAAHATAGFLLYKIGRFMWPGNVGKAGGLIGAFVFVLFPSPLGWFGQNHKDTFFIPGVLTVLLCFVTLFKIQLSWTKFFRICAITLAGLMAVLLMRPKYACLALAGILLPSLLVCQISRNFCERQRVNFKQNLMVGLLAILVAFFAAGTMRIPDSYIGGEFLGGVGPEGTDLEESWQPNRLLPKPLDDGLRKISGLRAHFASYGLALGAGSMIDTDIRPKSAGELFAYLPRAFWIGLFAPFPSHWLEKTTAIRLVGSIETFVWYLFFPGLVYLIIRKSNSALWFAVVFCAGMVTLYSCVYPNLGTLYRMRFGFWMIFLTCGAVGWMGVLLPLLDKVDFRRTARGWPLYNPAFRRKNIPRRNLGQLFVAGGPALMLAWVGFLGYFLRDLLLIRLQGLGSSLDVLLSAMMFVMVAVSCLSLPLADVLSRPLQEALRAKETGMGEHLVQEWLRIAVIILGGACLFLWLAAPRLGVVFLGGKEPSLVSQFIFFFRLCLPILFFSAWTVLGNAVLNNLYKAGRAAAAQLALPLTSIFAIVVSPADAKLEAAIFGAVLGTILNAIVVSVLCACHGIRLWPSRRSVALFHGSLTQNYVWLVPFAVMSALAAPVNYFFAGQAGGGSITLWALSAKITTCFSQFICLAAASLILPHLAGIFEKGKNFSGREHVYVLLIIGTWLGGFCALGLSLFADPLTGFLLSPVAGQGSVQAFAHLVRIGALQIPVAMAAAILVKSATVSGAIPQATWGAFCGLLVNIVLNILLVPRLGLSGIACGALAGATVMTLAACLGARADFGISRGLAMVLLLTWAVWAGVIFSVESRQAPVMAAAAGGLMVLGLLHREGWRKGWAHKTEARASNVLS